MNTSPLVSIILPVYNTGIKLKRAIVSVLSQTYCNYELIIINDGSTDDKTLSIIKNYKDNDKIVLINQANKGVSAARNAGLDAADGDYIMLLDADDFYEDDLIQSNLDIMSLYKDAGIDVDILIKDTWVLYEDTGKRIATSFFSEEKLYFEDEKYAFIESLFTKTTYGNKGGLYSKKLSEKKGARFDERLRICEDVDWNLRLMLKAKTIVASPETKHVYCLYNRGSWENVGRYESQVIASRLWVRRIKRSNYPDSLKTTLLNTFVGLYFGFSLGIPSFPEYEQGVAYSICKKNAYLLKECEGLKYSIAYEMIRILGERRMIFYFAKVYGIKEKVKSIIKRVQSINMMSIKKSIKENDKVYYLYRLLKHSKDPSFRKRVLDITDSSSSVRVERLGDLNPDRLFYLIDIDDKGNHSGLFALLNDTIHRLELARRLGAEPYVKWSNTPYGSKTKCGSNDFESYFFQPTSATYKEVLHSQNVIISRSQDGVDKELGGVYDAKIDYEKAVSSLFAQYVKYCDDVNDRIQDDLKSICLDNTNRLNDAIGVHFRGTDYKQGLKGHPTYVSFQEYSDAIMYMAEKWKVKDVFICTDDKDALEFFTDGLKGLNVLSYPDTKRSRGNVGLHYLYGKDGSKENKIVDLGYEVLRDVETLSRCGYIVSGVSYVSFSARAIKRSRNEQYADSKIVSNGLNNEGIKSVEFNHRFNMILEKQ